MLWILQEWLQFLQRLFGLVPLAAHHEHAKLGGGRVIQTTTGLLDQLFHSATKVDEVYKEVIEDIPVWI